MYIWTMKWGYYNLPYIGIVVRGDLESQNDAIIVEIQNDVRRK